MPTSQCPPLSFLQAGCPSCRPTNSVKALKELWYYYTADSIRRAALLIQRQQHPFNGPLSETTRVSRYQKGKTNLDLLEQEIVSGSGISWAICKSAVCSPWWSRTYSRRAVKRLCVCSIISTSNKLLQTDNHTSTPPLIFLQDGCPSCHLTNSIRLMQHWHLTIQPVLLLPLVSLENYLTKKLLFYR